MPNLRGRIADPTEKIAKYQRGNHLFSLGKSESPLEKRAFFIGENSFFRGRISR
jgi:hypothetical protein